MPLPLLSFFTGAGFLDLGFELAGFRAVWHNEIDDSFAQGFACGMSAVGNTQRSIECRDSIIDVGPNQIYKAVSPHFHGLRGKREFGIIGGPPCPDFSVGGTNAGGGGERGRLSQVYVARILDLQPTFFVFENVRGLISTAIHREFFSGLQDQLATDFHTDVRVLNALEFGVPQDRDRVFLIGFHKSWMRRAKPKVIPVGKGWFPWPIPTFPNAKRKFPWPTNSPFGSALERPVGVPPELTVWHHLHDTVALSVMPNGLDTLVARSDRMQSVQEGDTSRKSFKRLHRWRYSPTVAYGNNEVHLHPTLPRRLSVREALRLQSVPDSYYLPASMALTHKFKTVCNGVPVKLAQALATSISQFMEE